MAERGLSVDHVTVWRWVQHYAPILNQRLRRELRRPNRSWRVNDTYVLVAGKWAFLYWAVDSSGDTIDFMLSPKRDLTAAKLFLRLALSGTAGIRPWVINVNEHPAHARATAELKHSGDLSPRCRCRPSPYLNNIIEQDHIDLSSSAWRRVCGSGRQKEHYGRSMGYEAMHLIRKGRSDGCRRTMWLGNAGSFIPSLASLRSSTPHTTGLSPSSDPVCNRSRMACTLPGNPAMKGRTKLSRTAVFPSSVPVGGGVQRHPYSRRESCAHRCLSRHRNTLG